MALATAYTTRYNRLRVRAGLIVGRLWDRTAGLDDSAARVFTEAAAGVATAAQGAAAGLLDGYVAALGTFATGTLVRPAGIDPETVSGPAARNGAEPVDVYHRSVVTARAAVAEGQTFDEAMRYGRQRSVSTAETDVTLAQRLALLFVIGGDERIVGYRRVLTGQSCSLCATASTQRYRRGDLMPIHNHCDCGIAPIYGTVDPGHVINSERLSDLKAAGRASGDPQFWQSRRIDVDEHGTVRFPDVTVHQHGELGPVLTEATHGFTSQSDLHVA